MRKCPASFARCLSRCTIGCRSYSSAKPLIHHDGGSKVENLPAELEQPAQQIADDSTRRNPSPSSDGACVSEDTFERRQLPISPLMVQEFLAAKQKHRQRKAPRSKNPTLFQQQLAKNPYGSSGYSPSKNNKLTASQSSS